MQALAKHFSEQAWPATSFPSDDAAARRAQSAMTAAHAPPSISVSASEERIPRVADQQSVYLEKKMLE